LIEKAKTIKNQFYQKEYLFFLNIAPMDYNSDFDKDSIEYVNQIIENLAFLENKIEKSNSALFK